MRPPSRPLIYGTGIFVLGHHLMAGYGDLRERDGQIKAPPVAAFALSAGSTGTISSVSISYSAVNTVTGARHFTHPITRVGSVQTSS